MNNQERMIQKIKAEPDQRLRIMKMIMFVYEYGSVEEKNSMEKKLNETVRFPEKMGF